MKIVIISKECFPVLSPRSHRTTELAKEFAQRGHEVIVYALLGDYDYSKFSMETKITLKNLGKSKFGIEDNTGYYNRTIFYRIFRKVFNKYLEFPNIELIHMVKKALKKEGGIDFLVTIAGPHTIHWGAANYVKKNKSKINFYVADCGDPFMKDPFNFHPFYFEHYEKKWGKLCDYISVPVPEAINAYYSEFKNKIRVIPQGFDFDDFELAEYKVNQIPTFAYSGILYRDKRDITQFFEYLLQLKASFKFIMYTKSTTLVAPYMNKMGNKLELRDYVPRKELLFELSRMDFLVNIANNSYVQIPSKLIDYAVTKRPILELSSPFKESKEFKEFLEGNYRDAKIIKDIDQYNIKNVANAFLNLKNELNQK